MRSMFAVVARELREKYGETLQSMADEFGVSFQYLSLLETCKGKSLRRITPNNAERYRSFFLRCGATKEELEELKIGLLVHNGRIVVSDLDPEHVKLLVIISRMNVTPEECRVLQQKVKGWVDLS